LADLVPSVFGSLNENGYFYDPVERGEVLRIPNVILIAPLKMSLHMKVSLFFFFFPW